MNWLPCIASFTSLEFSFKLNFICSLFQMQIHYLVSWKIRLLFSCQSFEKKKGSSLENAFLDAYVFFLSFSYLNRIHGNVTVYFIKISLFSFF